MTQRLARFFQERASGRNVLLVFCAALGVFALFGMVLVPAFQSVTHGLYPIDMSFPTTPAVIYRELPQYTEASRRVYAWFFALDLIWPPLLATLFALSWCWLATRTRHPLPQQMIARGVLLLPFAEALLDWLENLGFILLINAYPGKLLGLALATGTVKHAKLVLYALCWLVTLLFIALALGRPARPASAATAALRP
jgi:hypothetical protein